MVSWTQLRILRPSQGQHKGILGLEMGRWPRICKETMLELEMEDKHCRLLMTLMRILRMMPQLILTRWRTGDNRDQLTQTGSLVTKGRKR